MPKILAGLGPRRMSVQSRSRAGGEVAWVRDPWVAGPAPNAAERSCQREPRRRSRGLPPFWRTVTLFNPLVYLISGFRWSFLDVADVQVGLSLAITVGFLALCMAIVSWFFKTGYRLKKQQAGQEADALQLSHDPQLPTCPELLRRISHR